MSRLDSFIRRLQAQRTCLDDAVARIHAVPGWVLELGLGNGRTYDHLRERCPEREIFCFDRQNAAHPSCSPDPGHLVLGDLRDTLPAFRRRGAQRAALVHADIGSGHPERDARLAADLTDPLAELMGDAAVAVSDQPLEHADLRTLPAPSGVAPGRYFMYLRRPRG